VVRNPAFRDGRTGNCQDACVPVLEVRRHSIRKHGGGSQLSQEGVALAREVGASMGPFACVVTSVVPRARETAVAMGFAVDHELVTLASDPEIYSEAAAVEWTDHPNKFAGLSSIVAAGGAYANYAHSMAAIWRDLLTPLGADDRVLVIGHSGELEATLIACFPGAAHGEWGSFFGPCEGAALTFEGEPAHFQAVDFIRL
jgi:broad specificity phosphatase PhoE